MKTKTTPHSKEKMKPEVGTSEKMKTKNEKIYEKYKHLTPEETERSIKYWNKRIKYEHLKRGITTNRDTNQEKRYRKYVKEENELRDILRGTPYENLIPSTLETYDAPGKKKPDKHTYPTTSKMEWDAINNEKKGIEHPQIKTLREEKHKQILNEPEKLPTKYLNETKETPVMIYDGKEIIFMQAKVKPRIKTRQTIQVWRKGNSKQRLKCEVEEWDWHEEENKIISTPAGEITVKSLIKTMLQTDAKIYKLITLYNRKGEEIM